MKKKKLFRWIGLFAGCAILLQVPSVWAGDDFQYWQGMEIKKKLSPTWEFAFMPEIRIRDDAGDYFYHDFRQCIRFKPSKDLTIGMNYLFARNGSSGKPRDEHSAELEATPRVNVGPLELSMRGRVSLRTIERSAGEQEFQLRLLPKIAYPTQCAGHKVTPYIGNDFFYDFTAEAWNQHRTFLGVVIPLGEWKGITTSIDMYYMIQSQRSARKDWNTNHIVGSKLGIQF